MCGYKIQIFKNEYRHVFHSYCAISNSISGKTENDTVFLQGEIHIHVDFEITLLRIYYKEKVNMTKGLTMVLVTALFIIIMKSWKQILLLGDVELVK